MVRISFVLELLYGRSSTLMTDLNQSTSNCLKLISVNRKALTDTGHLQLDFIITFIQGLFST